MADRDDNRDFLVFPKPSPVPKAFALALMRAGDKARREAAARPRNPYAIATTVIAGCILGLFLAAIHGTTVSAWSPDAGRSPGLALVGFALLAPYVLLNLAWARWRLANPYGKPRRAVASNLTAALLLVPTLGYIAAVILRAEGVTHFRAGEAARWVRVTPDGKGIAIVSGIKAGIADRFEALLAANPGVTTVHLMSEGGLAGEGYRIADMVRRAGLDTVAIGYCLSACTDIHLAGRRRFAVDGIETLGYHGIGSALLPVVWTPPRSGSRQGYLDAGFSEGFVARIETVPHYDMWTPDGATLLAEGAIHGIVPREDTIGIRWMPRAEGNAKASTTYGGWLGKAFGHAPGEREALGAWTAVAWDAARNEIRVERHRRAYAARIVAAGLSDPEMPVGVLRDVASVLLKGMEAARGKSRIAEEADCARIGSGADLVTARARIAERSDRGDVPDPRLDEGLPAALGALPEGWARRAVPLPPVAEPGTWIGKAAEPGGTCADLLAWYASAIDPANPDGPGLLREGFAGIASGGGVGITGNGR